MLSFKALNNLFIIISIKFKIKFLFITLSCKFLQIGKDLNDLISNILIQKEDHLFFQF